MKTLILVGTILMASLCASAQKKPILYVPLTQPEIAYNFVKDCPDVEVSWILEKSNLVLSWGETTKDRMVWVLYRADGTVVDAGQTVRVSTGAKEICSAATKSK